MRLDRKLLTATFCSALLLAGAARAGSYHCLGGAKLSADQRSCSDGGIPVFEADSIQPVRPAAAVRESGSASVQTEAGPRNGDGAPKNGGLRYFFRGWALFVPGAAYQVPIGLTDYNRIVVSPGTGILHKLEIRADKTFRWDQTRGRWHLDKERNIVLVNAYEGKNWSVVRNEQDGGIYVMDGSTWFQAKE